MKKSVRRKILIVALFLTSLACLYILSESSWSGLTRLQLKEVGTGRRIFSALLKDGEQVVLTWKNSLFGLQVTEVFRTQAGILILTQITFADPSGSVPPAVRAADIDDLYHTGGPFSAQGLVRPFKQVVYRVGEIGDPKMKVKDRLVKFKEEVGFGGAVALSVKRPGFFEAIGARIFLDGGR